MTTKLDVDANAFSKSAVAAIEAVGGNAVKLSPQWILEGDIKGCFDHISHEWLMENIPMDTQVLQKWLKCGYVDTKQLFPTEEGTPQGGAISPTLMNMTLDGLERLLKERLIS